MRPLGLPRFRSSPSAAARSFKAPRATILVDTREQNPFDFSRFEGWFEEVEKKALKLGDYSLAGLEDQCVVERKDLSDLVHSLTVERSAFVNRLKLMSGYQHRLLVMTAPLSRIKSPYSFSAAYFPIAGGTSSRCECAFSVYGHS